MRRGASYRDANTPRRMARDDSAREPLLKRSGAIQSDGKSLRTSLKLMNNPKFRAVLVQSVRDSISPMRSDLVLRARSHDARARGRASRRASYGQDDGCATRRPVRGVGARVE